MGATFKDAKGRDWTLAITIGDRDDVVRVCDLDLYGVLDNNAQSLLRLFGNLPALGKVLFVLLADQAKEKQISPEDFAKGLSGPVLAKAKEAFQAALIDFFLSEPEKAEAIRQILAAQAEVTAEAIKAAKVRLTEMTAAEIAKVRFKIQETPLSELSGLAPDALG